jgi:two-component system LytT family response regulator
MSKQQSKESKEAPTHVDRIPIRQRNEVILVPVNEVASIVAEGETLHLVTVDNERHTFYFRLKDLEARLDPARFVRLGRGTLANVDQIKKVVQVPGRGLMAVLANGQELAISRIQARSVRDRLLTL